MIKTIRLLITSVTALALVSIAPATAFAQTTNQSILVPGYKYPTTWTSDLYWDGITSAGSSNIPFVIMNPSNGPGTAVNSDYTTQIANNAAAGIKNIGYVDTSYQSRPIADVLQDIDRWYSMYSPVSGIMFDQISDASPAQVCYLASLYNYVKYYHPESIVVANPGTHISDAISPYADIFITTETSGANYLSSYVASTSNFETNSANQSHIMHIIHDVSPADYTNVIAKTRAENAGWVYITDDTMPNPYDQLPTNFSSFTADVATLPQTVAPNGSVASLPTGCVDVIANTTQPSSNSYNINLTNQATSLQPMLIPANIKFTLPQGVTIKSVGGTGWTCTGNDCVLNPRLEIGASSPTLAVQFESICGLGNPQVTYNATGRDGTIYSSGQLAVASIACPAAVVVDDADTTADLASTGQPLGLSLIAASVAIVLGLVLKRLAR